MQQLLGQSAMRSRRLRLNQVHKIYLIRDYAYNFNVHSLEAEALLAKSNAPDVDTKW
ncbi:hypothetical protein [Nostoc sp. C052]|uniref:hypothetical protein n=1 Tax=Nostoc sp. C052 TaxID=2576902 RepID=UPI0015C2F416|nr:hypothetical protein [Nostoc sp. C052]